MERGIGGRRFIKSENWKKENRIKSKKKTVIFKEKRKRHSSDDKYKAGPAFLGTQTLSFYNTLP